MRQELSDGAGLLRKERYVVRNHGPRFGPFEEQTKNTDVHIDGLFDKPASRRMR